jgi:hypothetical protein
MEEKRIDGGEKERKRKRKKDEDFRGEKKLQRKR